MRQIENNVRCYMQLRFAIEALRRIAFVGCCLAVIHALRIRQYILSTSKSNNSDETLPYPLRLQTKASVLSPK